jgi:hypothetical protein
MERHNNKADTKTLMLVIIFLSILVILLFGLRSLI